MLIFVIIVWLFWGSILIKNNQLLQPAVADIFSSVLGHFVGLALKELITFWWSHSQNKYSECICLFTNLQILTYLQSGIIQIWIFKFSLSSIVGIQIRF